jgi:methylmalonyl-CoA mutase cobalamin-binding subunit
MSTLREALRDALPRVPLKEAWRAQIQAARAAGREDGTKIVLSSRSAIESALGQEICSEADVSGLKDALRRLLAANPAARSLIAVEIESRVQEIVGRVTTEPVLLTVRGWPEWLGSADRARVLGQSEESLCQVDPGVAAYLQRELHGLCLGGSTLKVEVQLPLGERLPAVSRSKRSRPRARGARPWLPFLDEQGRISLTPETLAREHAQMLALHRIVIDPYCGCGADAIAMAQAGLSVIAIEQDAGRLALAKQNAQALGVSERIEFHLGRAEQLIDSLQRASPDAAVYLDPPWGGTDWDRAGRGLSQIFSPQVLAVCTRAPRLLLKAPRALDPSTLPRLAQAWQLSPAWSPRAASPAERMLFLRACTST